MNEKKYNVICLSNQLWDFPAWTNKKQVMTRLDAQGHNVVFVDPPVNLGFVMLRQIYRGLWNLPRLLTQTKKQGALVYTPINLFPFSWITSYLHITKIKKLAKKEFDPNLKTILWVYHVQIPDLKKYVEGLKYDILIYDCVDNYSGFPRTATIFPTTVGGTDLEVQEEYLTKKADLVWVTAPGLVDKLKKYRDVVYFTPNVGDYEKFRIAKTLQVPEDIEGIPHPIIGFAGALDDYKFDIDLFKKIAEEYESYSFILIGQMALKDAGASLDLEGLKNVHLLGTRRYEVVQNYFSAFDAFIIPYRLNDYTVGGCFPVKFHDSLAVGLPTVVTDMPAYYPFSDVCYISKNYEEFSQNLKKAIEEDSEEKRAKRQAVAKENNWDGKVEKMLGYIAEATK